MRIYNIFLSLNIWVFCGLICQSIGCHSFTQDLGGYAKDFVSPIDEIDFFLDGSLTYTYEGKSFIARKGDVVFFEKGEKTRFVTDEGCSVFFTTFPLMIETVGALIKEKEQQEQTG